MEREKTERILINHQWGNQSYRENLIKDLRNRQWEDQWFQVIWRAEQCQNRKLLRQNTQIRKPGHNSRDQLKKAKNLHKQETDPRRDLHKVEIDLLRGLHKQETDLHTDHQETDLLRGLHKVVTDLHTDLQETDLLRGLHKVVTDLHTDLQETDLLRGLHKVVTDLHTKPKKHISRPKFEEEPEVNVEELPEGTIIVNVPITVAGFCEQAEITTTSVIMKLMKLGIMANINQSIDEDIVFVLAEELGINVVIGRVSEEVVEEGIETFEDKETELKFRPPIITVMGHVDHGKTSLLDAIRKTNVTESESGGITQHIGASEIVINNHKIVFLDTPGHEAFTAMRARGAHVTDIAVLVVAADDSVKPQTVESISHAKAAGVPVIVAVNKMDKPAADLDKVKKDLSTHGILVEEWGGDTICVPVSAKTGEGIVTLLEMILLQAEILELKANPNRLASGTVIEARIDKARGTVATLLVLNGTLHSGDSIVAGTSSGKIKLMVNHLGETIKKAGPATAVEIQL